jgi:hypothetical protein
MPMPPLTPIDIAMQMACGYIASSALNAAARLKIADLLNNGPKHVTDLAKETSTSADILYRILRALASSGVFVEVTPHVFANTPISEVIRSDHPQSIYDMVIWICDAFHYDCYRDMMPILQDGKSAAEHVFQKPVFEAIFSDPDLARSFNNAMTSMSAQVIPAVLQAYDFSGIGTLADIAGGHGFAITSILKKYPEMKGILFDLPNVVVGASDRIEKMQLIDRLKVVEGDFFESVPRADAYIMKHIIHDWDDEKSIAIIKNCGKNLESGGKVILIETVLPIGNEPHMGKWIDIEMFMLPGGRERTKEEFRELFDRAGFKLNKVVPTQSPLWVVESEKV